MSVPTTALPSPTATPPTTTISGEQYYSLLSAIYQLHTGQLDGGAIAGIVIGMILVVMILVVGIITLAILVK